MAFPASEAAIAAAEKSLGRTLPEPLRSRIAQSNGGEVFTDSDDWELIPVRDDADRKRLARSTYDILRETEEARKWQNFPSGGVAIASNGAGDLLVLVPNDDNVWIWRHETGTVYSATIQWS